MISEWLFDLVVPFHIINVHNTVNLSIGTELTILWVAYRRCELLALPELSCKLSLSDVKYLKCLWASQDLVAIRMKVELSNVQLRNLEIAQVFEVLEFSIMFNVVDGNLRIDGTNC